MFLLSLTVAQQTFLAIADLDRGDGGEGEDVAVGSLGSLSGGYRSFRRPHRVRDPAQGETKSDQVFKLTRQDELRSHWGRSRSEEELPGFGHALLGGDLAGREGLRE